MKRFKEFLQEAGIFDYEGGSVDFENLGGSTMSLIFGMEFEWFPIYGKQQERIQGQTKPIKAWHVTGEDGISGIRSLKGAKTGSFFTQSDGDILYGANTAGGILVEVTGRSVLLGNRDIDSKTDEQGRKWVKIDQIADKGFKLGHEIGDYMEELFEKLKSQGAELPDEFWEMDPDQQYGEEEYDQKAKFTLVKAFFDWTEKWMTDNADEVARNLREVGNLNDGWNEVLLDRVKVDRVYVYCPEEELDLEVLVDNWNAVKGAGYKPTLLYDANIPFPDMKGGKVSIRNLPYAPSRDELKQIKVALK